jgi:SAM-dependent methyltransferase
MKSAKQNGSALFCATAADAEQLAVRLSEFYNSTKDYGAFHAPSNQSALWLHVAHATRLMRAVSAGRKVRILEAGAGRSGLAGYFRREGLRDEAVLHAQDVTKANEGWLTDEFDAVTVGDVAKVKGEFDIVLNSYVLEHVTKPQEFLNNLWLRVAPGGSLLLVCPRYDFPFYLSRSADHLNWSRRVAVALWVSTRRLRTFLSIRPAWLVHNDPAVFHLPFFRDRDAVHWVSWFDLRAFWPDIQPLQLDYKGFREAIRIRCLTVAFRRDKAAVAPR